MILPAGIYQKPEVTRPRKMGVRGPTPMNTGVSQVFIEGVPRRRFGYFAAAGKVTSVPHKNKTYPHSL